MTVAFASYRTKNTEKNRSQELIPLHIRNSAQNLIAYIEDYYSYLEKNGLPSDVITCLNENQDIDSENDIFLEKIQAEIASAIPDNASLNKPKLFKRIVDLYKMRGTEDGIRQFFLIFFDEIVDIFYPNQQLFKLSSGDWDNTNEIYNNSKGFASSYDKIQDGDYWQQFSYEIRSGVSVNSWKEHFLKFGHPAGLKLFAALLIVATRLGRWDQEENFSSTNPDDLSINNWLMKLIPPWKRDIDSYEAYHIPTYQPGWLDADLRSIVNLLSVKYHQTEVGLVRKALVLLILVAESDTNRHSLVREEYKREFQYRDNVPIATIKNFTYNQINEEFTNFQNACPFSNLSSIITTINN